MAFDVRPPGSRPCERVLVIDDNEDMLATMKDILELEGAVVRTARSADDAVAVVAGGFDPSAIVLDVRLANGDHAEEVANRLQSDPRSADVPIVLMSGDLQELRRLEPRVDATIAKPFDLDRLHDILGELCAERG
jgi:CheY-like chemotaxis protein